MESGSSASGDRVDMIVGMLTLGADAVATVIARAAALRSEGICSWEYGE